MSKLVKKLNNLNYKKGPWGLLRNVLENNSSNEFAWVKFARLLVGENGQIKIGQITTVPTTNVHVAPVKPPKTDPSIYCCFSANHPRRFSASHTNGGTMGGSTVAPNPIFTRFIVTQFRPVSSNEQSTSAPRFCQ